MMQTHYEGFIKKIHEIYGPRADVILNPKPHEVRTSFRVNTIRFDTDTVIKTLSQEGFVLVPGPFENSFVVQDGPYPLSQAELFSQGALYIQELSSMIPPLVLHPQSGQSIIDLCAAPGSKTTQLAELTNDQAHIVAVEKDPRRYQKLTAVLTLHGTQSVTPIRADGYDLTRRFPHYTDFFDTILLDAPCSNESYFDPTTPEAFSFWSQKRVKLCSNIQKGLILSAVAMLRPGGRLAYSTCTYSIEENEMVLSWLLGKVDTMQVVSVELGDTVPTIPGIMQYKGKHLDPSVALARRVLPQRGFRGFFIALLEKHA